MKLNKKLIQEFRSLGSNIRAFGWGFFLQILLLFLHVFQAHTYFVLVTSRFGNKSSEIQLAHVMTVHMNGSPSDLGVKVKLRLQSHDQDVNDIPYKPAIDELGSISSQVTLLGKLESLGTNFQFYRNPQQNKKLIHIHMIPA